MPARAFKTQNVEGGTRRSHFGQMGICTPAWTPASCFFGPFVTLVPGSYLLLLLFSWKCLAEPRDGMPRARGFPYPRQTASEGIDDFHFSKCPAILQVLAVKDGGTGLEGTCHDETVVETVLGLALNPEGFVEEFG